MKYLDVENMVNDDLMFNIFVPIDVVKELMDREYAYAPERARVEMGAFLVGKFGNFISLIGHSYDFTRAYWWNEIKDNLEIDTMNDGTDTWNIDYKED